MDRRIRHVRIHPASPRLLTLLPETIGWITQLVVDANERRKRIATNLLRGLVASSWFAGVTMMGIASTHPAALNALCNMLPGRSGYWTSIEPKAKSHSISGQSISRVGLSYIQENAPMALQSSTVKYLRQAQLRGALFEPNVEDGAVSLADTTFFVDHGEPEEVLSSYVKQEKWSLGPLREGHEYLLVLPTTSSRSTSSTHSV